MKKQNLKLILVAFLIILSPAACSRKELDKDSSTVDKAQVYGLLEQRQRVIRYNCQGQVTSDQVESVKTPIEHLSVHPKTMELIYSSSFENVTIGTVAGSIVNYTDFTIDLNPGALNLEVKQGINEIKYKFFYCAQRLPVPNDGQCAQASELRETGSIFINVTYQETDLPGELVVKPTPEECAPKAYLQ